MSARIINLRLNNPRILAAILLTLMGGIVAGLGAFVIDYIFYLILAVLSLPVIFIIIQKPDISLYILVFITYTHLSSVLVEHHNLPSIAKFYIPLLLGIVGLRWIIYKEYPRGWQLAYITLTIYGFVIGFSVLYARNTGQAISEFSDFIKDAIMVIVIVLFLQRGVTLKRVIWALLLAGIFLGSLTTYQQLTGSFDNNFWGFANAEVRNIFGEVNDYRVQGPISSNYYAMILVVLVPLGIDRFLNEKSLWLRLLAVWLLMVSTLSILFTFSRGGLLALALVVILMLIRYPPKPVHLLAIVFILSLIVLVVPSSYVERLSNLTQIASKVVSGSDDVSPLQENALRGRLSEMTVSFMVFADHPLTGVGFANFEEYYLEYSPALGLDSRRENRAAHSLYLEIAAETGLPGLAAFGFLLFAVFRALRWSYKRFTRAGLENYAHITYALAIGLTGYLAGSIFLHAAYFRYFWLFIGIACALPQVAKNEVEIEGR